MRTARVLVTAGLAALLVLALSAAAVSPQVQRFRWDLVHFSPGPPTAVSEGGIAGAFAHEGHSIVLTGSGTFAADGSSVAGAGRGWSSTPPAQ